MKALTFKDKKRTRYEYIKEKLFSRKSQQSDLYKRIPRSFCLADEYSYENVYPYKWIPDRVGIQGR